MADMVAYEERHNEENGENNQDGLEYNCTWNCGVEGPTRKQNVRQLRFRQLKNAFAMLLFSQGTPMIFQGDEWGNSQKGNNNAWCQDNEIGWVDWRGMKKNGKLLDFVKKAIDFRKKIPFSIWKQNLKGVITKPWDIRIFPIMENSLVSGQRQQPEISGRDVLRRLCGTGPGFSLSGL